MTENREMDAAYRARLYESGRKLFPEIFTDLDHDLDRSRSLYLLRSRSDLDQASEENFWGKYAPLLREDILYLLARQWKCCPGTLTNATKRMGPDWVRQQIEFVKTRTGVRNRGRYLAAILARNAH